jgi:galactose mutarotase-like enzyme
MKKIHLQHLSKDGKLLEAIFSPDHGMNLLSFKKDGLEYIAQDTKEEFLERYAGLGALIGPHFHHRKKEKIPRGNNVSIFPHIAKLDLSKGGDPLSHGIGRYSSWNVQETSTSVTAHLCGLDTKEGVTLASLEGFNFKMNFTGHLTNTGLDIKYHVQSEVEPSTIGLHYYLALPEKEGFVTIPCKKEYNDMGTSKTIPDSWLNEKGFLHFNLQEASDFGFHPNTDDFSGEATLSTPSRKLHISYKADGEQNAFQIYHPKDATFVCIEPVSAKDPRAPSGTNHKLHIKIDIL